VHKADMAEYLSEAGKAYAEGASKDVLARTERNFLAQVGFTPPIHEFLASPVMERVRGDCMALTEGGAPWPTSKWVRVRNAFLASACLLTASRAGAGRNLTRELVMNATKGVSDDGKFAVVTALNISRHKTAKRGAACINFLASDFEALKK
jgi:hypothetical protein